MVTFQESLDVLWDHDTCHLLCTGSSLLLLLPSPGAGTVRKEAGAGTPQGGSRNCRALLRCLVLPSSPVLMQAAGCPAPDTELLHTPELQPTGCKVPHPPQQQQNPHTCAGFVTRWHLVVHLLCYHAIQCTCG